MELFEKIGDKITSKSKDVAKKAKDMTELAKLNSRVHDYEGMARGLEQQVGRLYFKENRNNPAAEYMELFQQLINAYGAMERCKEEIQSIKGIRSCINCGADIQTDALFCPSCGAKNEVVVAESTVSAPGVICPNCGISLSADTVFCSGCGTKVRG